MNPHDEKQLEAVISRELKALPNLRAPRSLATRVMATIEQRQAVPWYRQAWQYWPLPLRAVAVLVLVASFSGLCFLSWQFVRTPDFAAASSRVGSLFGSLGVIWNALGVLISALFLAVKNVNPALLIGCGVALALGYAMCLGLGTVYVRLGFARR
jgi:hypothetical protein